MRSKRDSIVLMAMVPDEVCSEMDKVTALPRQQCYGDLEDSGLGC